jgi:hypothetical protein
VRFNTLRLTPPLLSTLSPLGRRLVANAEMLTSAGICR